MSGKKFNDLSALSLPVLATDGRMVARSNEIFSAPMHGRTVTVPTTTVFSTAFDDTVNSSAGVVTGSSTGIRISKINTTTSNVNDWCARFKAIPGATNWTATFLLQRLSSGRERMCSGPILRHASSGNWGTIGWFTNTFPTIIGGCKWTGSGDNLGDAVAQISSAENPHLCWFQIQKDNSASLYRFKFSHDGQFFIDLYDVAITSGIWGSGNTPDQIGVGVCSNCKDPVQNCVIDFLSYDEV